VLEARRLQGARQGAQVCINAAEVIEHEHTIRRHQPCQVGEERAAEQPCRQGPACQRKCSRSAQQSITLFGGRSLSSCFDTGSAEHAHTEISVPDMGARVMTALTHHKHHSDTSICHLTLDTSTTFTTCAPVKTSCRTKS